MSSDVNKDIQQAIINAQGNGGGNSGSISISQPTMLKHSIDLSKVSIPEPVYTQDGKGEK